MPHYEWIEHTSDHAASGSLGRFKAFMDSLPPDHEPSYLHQYIRAWLDNGDAVETTGGSFSTYLRTCLFIADAAMKDPSFLEYTPYEEGSHSIPRRLLGIVDPNDSIAFSREYYEAVVFHRQLPHSLHPMFDADPS